MLTDNLLRICTGTNLLKIVSALILNNPLPVTNKFSVNDVFTTMSPTVIVPPSKFEFTLTSKIFCVSCIEDFISKLLSAISTMTSPLKTTSVMNDTPPLPCMLNEPALVLIVVLFRLVLPVTLNELLTCVAPSRTIPADEINDIS